MINRLLWMRLPLAIYLLMVLSSAVAGSVIIHLTLMNNLVDGNWLYLKEEYLKMIFPKAWSVGRSIMNINGSVYVINLFDEDYRVILHFEFYSREATQNFMESKNLTHISAVPYFDAQEIYRWARERNNATLYILEVNPDLSSFLKNWARSRNYEIYYLLINIKNAFVIDGIPYNATGLILSSLIDQKLIKIIFYGEENSWSENRNNFMRMLNSTEILVEKW